MTSRTLLFPLLPGVLGSLKAAPLAQRPTPPHPHPAPSAAWGGCLSSLPGGLREVRWGGQSCCCAIASLVVLSPNPGTGLCK